MLVDAFDGGLVPVLGDPDASRTLGKAVQGVAGLLVAYHLVRAGLWAYLAVLSQDTIRARTDAGQEGLMIVGKLIDQTTTVFWPSLIAALVVDLLWRRKRRPKDVLQAHGEAYVEAGFTRVVPVGWRIASAAVLGLAVVVGTSGSTSRLRSSSEVASFAMSRSLSSVLWAMVWTGSIVFVIASERHLARRVAKAMDPALASFSVPYVEPEVDSATTGEPSGVGWILRTAGLVILGLFSLLIVIGAIAELPSGKNGAAAILWLAGGGAVLALVAWAFVRRWQHRSNAPVLHERADDQAAA
jgi:hypothetical protein